LFSFSGTLIYVTVLLTNAVAILSEERFLARSEQQQMGAYVSDVNPSAGTVGWSTTQLPAGYDQNAYTDQVGEGVKARLIVLVSAVRTLLRGELMSI